MPIEYYKGLLCSALFSALFLFSYYYYNIPDTEAAESVIETQYSFVQVDGPIQPIPQLMVFDPEWVQLGKALFNSKLLSKDNSISCASCHVLDYGGDDGLPVSFGVGNRLGTRNSPTVFNAVFNFRQFWDGRSSDLDEQVTGPVHNPDEMATSWDEVILKLKNDSEFNLVFSTLSIEGVTEQNIVKAIRHFEESLITPNAAIDRYLLGEKEALSAQQQRGLDKFIHFGCSSCHQGRNIGGNLYQKIGRVDQVPYELLEDLGRYLITGDEADRHVFKVPSLRNIAQTAPYFHNGSVATLEEAIDIMAKGQLGMNLSAEDIADLVALLQAFSGVPYSEINNEQS